MFDLDKFLEKHSEFNDLNENQYIALYTYIDNEKKYLTEDRELTTDKCKALVKPKRSIMKGFGYLVAIEKMDLKFEEYEAIMSSESCNLAFRLKMDDDIYNKTYFPETDEWYNNNDGLTDDERVIQEHCVEINDLFKLLPQHHPQHVNEMVQAVNIIQHLLQSRTCHRLYPDVYPIYRKDDK